MKYTEQTEAAPGFLLPSRRKAVRVSREAMVGSRCYDEARQLPLVIEPAVEGLNLIEWARGSRQSLEEQLLGHGALLFRGFGVQSAEEFEQVVRALAGEPLQYHERSSPRSQVSGRIYSSTDYPDEQHIFLHNENSYQLNWPLRLFFYCQTAPREGGETPIASCRRLFARLSGPTKEKFVRKGCMYVRNYGAGFGLPWQTVFQTTDRAVVEAYCEKNKIAAEWRGGGVLRTRAVRPAVVRHPQTGETVWFNHATFFHITTLGATLRGALLAQFEEQDLPSNSYYGDGSAIEPEVLEELREAYRQETVAFPWHKGDVLMLDNVLTAHGRRPFVGPRKILVGMAQPHSWDEV